MVPQAAKIVVVRRLLPTQAENIPPIVAYVDPIRRRHADGRPWVALCMISSIDGSTVVDGRSGSLGSPTDTAVLGALRQLADMVLVGAQTVRSEGYGAPRKAGLRIGVVTTDGSTLDLTGPLFSSGSGFLVTTEDAPDLPVDTLRAGRGRVDLRRALRRLGVDFVHVEGGAHLNAALFDAGVVDEVNVTISPYVAGGDGPRLLNHADARLSRFELAQLCEEDGYLFCRYVRRRDSETPDPESDAGN